MSAPTPGAPSSDPRGHGRPADDPCGAVGATNSERVRTPAREVPYSRAIPRPTGAPLVAAAGVTLMAAGVVTNWMVTLVGVAMALGGAVAWFRQVLPDEQLEEIPASAREALPAAARAEARQVTEGPRRLALPLEIHPYRTGIWGGLAGGAAMAVVACLWGLIREGSPWFPINLLAGTFVPGIEHEPVEALRAVHSGWLLTATVIHAVGSVFMGLLYTVALPMMPRRPILFGGILAPVFWSGLIWASLGIVNPALERFISWPWFIASQLAFGITAGIVISRFNRVPTMQFLPVRERLRVEASHGRTPDGGAA